MITHVDANDPRVAFTSRNDAVKMLRSIIAAAGDSPDLYDVDALADEVIGRQGRGYMTRFFIAPEGDEFWDALERHII